MSDHPDETGWTEWRVLADLDLCDGDGWRERRPIVTGSFDSAREAIGNMSRYPNLYRNFRVEMRTVSATPWEPVEVDPSAAGS